MRKILLPFLCLCALSHLSALTLNQARELFLAGDYETSRPVFENELKKKPNDASLNYWYGVCLYQAGEKERAVPYLQKGDKGRIKEAAYLLADCALLRYETKTCQNYLDRYLLYGTGLHTPEIARMLRQSQKIEQMLQAVEDVVFIDSLIVHKNDLSGHLNLHPVCGTVSYGEGMGWQQRDSLLGFVYGNEKGDRLIASETNALQTLDLVSYHRVPGGWEKENVGPSLNQEGNQCNPYLMSDGVTLYFASDGHQSIGGYDLYVSRYNPVTESYFSPEPLPLPFNSTANDYLCLIDEQIGRGLLVSDRRQAPDSVIVYTFLPNTSRRLVQGKNRETLVRLSEIRSIADTWNGLNADSVKNSLQADYEKAVKSFAAPVSPSRETAWQEAFFIRDGLVYHGENDFTSARAKAQYRQYKSLKDRLQSLSRRLEDSRRVYQATDNPKQKRLLASQIESLEADCWNLQQEIRKNENQIRALELAMLDTGTGSVSSSFDNH